MTAGFAVEELAVGATDSGGVQKEPLLVSSSADGASGRSNLI